MATYGARVLKSSIAIDWSQVQLGSALRRGVVVAIVLVGADWAFGPHAAVSATMAAFVVGLFDRRQSTRSLATMSLFGTLTLAAVALVAGLSDPWILVAAVLMALLAFAAGVSIAINQSVLVVLVLSTLTAATAVVEPQPANLVWGAALATLAGGSAQLVAILLCWRITRFPTLRERLAQAASHAANATSLVAAALGDGSLAAEARATSERVTDELLAVYSLITAAADSDSAVLADLSEALEQVWVDVRQAALLVGREGAQSIADADGLAADMLAIAAAVRQVGLQLDPSLGKRKSRGRRPAHAPAAGDAAGAAATAAVGASGAVSPSGSLPNPRDPALARRLGAAKAAAADVGDAGWTPVVTTPSSPLWGRVRAAVDPHSISFRHGVRMAVVALAGSAIAYLLGMGHGSWIAVSGVLLLRPDAGPSIPRVIKRAIGVTIAAGLVVGFVVVAGEQPAVLAVATVVAALVFFALKDTSYALFVAFLSVFVILLPCQMGASPVQLAGDRWLALFIGGVLSIVVMFIIPIWNSGRVPADISAFVQASSAWFRALGDVATTEPAERGEDGLGQCRRLGYRARLAGTAAWATMRAASVEPGRRGVRLVAAAGLMHKVGAVNELGVVVEGRLGSTWSVPAAVPGSLSATAVALQAADQELGDSILEFSAAGAGAGADPSRPPDRDACGRHVDEALADARTAALGSSL
jgi:uncharacterized membrane protein YccC